MIADDIVRCDDDVLSHNGIVVATRFLYIDIAINFAIDFFLQIGENCAIKIEL